MTESINKHLLPIFDKPMIYYPLTSLILAGATDVCIVSTSDGVFQFQKLLKTGLQWGINISYAIQDSPEGIADGISKALHTFETKESSLVILGDNIFYGTGLGRHISESIETDKCLIWTQEVNNPHNFGIITFDKDNNIDSIVEKPKTGNSKFAITGLYYFPKCINHKVTQIKKSNRGEYEIVDILNLYLKEIKLINNNLSRGVFWLDAGTVEDLNEASNFVKTVQTRQNQLIGSPDEASWRMGLISSQQFNNLITHMPNSSYKKELAKILN